MLTIGDRDFKLIVEFVRENYGIDLSKKRALVQGRLTNHIERMGYKSFTAYIADTLSNPCGIECRRMIDKLSTNHTFFFREPACFEHMRDVAVPRLAKRGVRNIEIWCAAASTGQECYTIAMMMEEALLRDPSLKYHILGSDINSEVLAVAKRGVYPSAELEAIPSRFHRRYCRKLPDSTFEISETLRERVTWQRINLVKPLTGVTKRHIIFCRNVMIYFLPEAKDVLTNELHRIVDDDGFVYVGSTETLDMKRTRFNYVAPSIFEKRRTTT